MWEKENGIVLSVLTEKHQAEGGKQHFIVKHVQINPLCMLGIALNFTIL